MQEPSESSSFSADKNLTFTAGEMLVQYSRVMQQLGKNQPDAHSSDTPMELAGLFASAISSNLANTEKMIKLNEQTQKQFIELANYMWKKAQGDDLISPMQPDGDDTRFRSDTWQNSPWFNATMQSYLLGAQYFQQLTEPPKHFDSKQAHKLKFFSEQLTDAMSPTNYFWTNPDAIEQAVKTSGNSIVEGMKNFADDLEAGNGVSMVDKSAFELGENIATTPGKVIARSPLAELIQYAPAKDKVYANPIMIIPPWINKYYILDLKPNNSFICWLVDQGYSVFVISWINPDESYRDTSFDDYLKFGPLWAMEQIKSVSNSAQINAIGYCLGGTLLATLLSYLAHHNDESIRSATFLTTMIDFSEPGDLGVFVDEKSVTQLEQMMHKTGYLDGSFMASTFSLMRAKDLVWFFVINNYLLGNKPGEFDLLYWNSDSTRMPARMHSEYLRWMYLENRLCTPGALTVLDTPIDLSKVTVPCYFLSTEMDHIAPWKSTYSGTQNFSGKVRFTLGESGHIAGVINPPEKKKYGFWSCGDSLPESPDEWLEQATNYKGSWWLDWQKWIRRHHGKKVEAQWLKVGLLKPLAEAPGTYVKM